MCRESIARGHRRIMLAAPTSFGKTLTAIEMLTSAAAKGKRAIFICDRIKLVDQTLAACDKLGVDVGVIQGDHWRTSYRKPIQIASSQTLARRIERFGSAMFDYDFAIIDEAHTVYETIGQLMLKFGGVVFIGLSATPYSKGLGKYYSDLVVPVTAEELLRDGYLCPVHYYGGRRVSTKGMKRRTLSTGGSDYDPKALAEATDGDSELVGDIVKNWLKWAEGTQTVAFSPSIKHSKYLCEMFRSHGIEAEHIDGYMEAAEREELFEAHDAGEFKILSCSRLLTVGWDSPQTVTCIDAFPTSSKITYVQRVGRIMRTLEGKEHAIYLDHAGNVERHGFSERICPESLDDGEKRFSETNQVKDKKEPKVRDCPECYQQMVGLRCKECGYEIPVHERIKSDDTILERIKDQPASVRANATYSHERKAEMLGEFLLYAKSRGYQDGWAAQKYKSKFGVWPDGISPAPVTEVGEEVSRWIKRENIRNAYARGKQYERGKYSKAG